MKIFLNYSFPIIIHNVVYPKGAQRMVPYPIAALIGGPKSNDCLCGTKSRYPIVFAYTTQCLLCIGWLIYVCILLLVLG